MAQRIWVVVALVGLVAGLAACGTEGGNEAADPVPEAGSEADDGALPPADPVAQARAESVDLTVDDFPAGWVSAPTTESDEDSPLNRCDPSFVDETDELGAFADEDFALGDMAGDQAAVVATETKVFTNADAAAAAVAPYADPAVLDCIHDGLVLLTGADEAHPDAIAFSSMPYDAGPTDSATAATGTYVVPSLDGGQLPVTITVLLFRSGDIASQMLVQVIGDEIDQGQLRGPVGRLQELLAEA